MSTIESVPVVRYKPFDERMLDVQYRTLTEKVLTRGELEPETPQGYQALILFGETHMVFHLENGIPVITERDVCSGERSIFSQAIGELCAFLNGASTQEDMERFGCYWWKPWTSKELLERIDVDVAPGELGAGSYPGGWTRFPMPDGGTFNQIRGLLRQMREWPYLLRHYVSPWIPYYTYRAQEGMLPKVVVAPCHGWFNIHLSPTRRELSLHHMQRSADVLCGLPGNLIQYAVLAMMFAQVLGYTAKKLCYTISHANMYVSNDPEHDQRIPARQLLQTSPERLPTVHLDPSVDDLFAFRREHFSIWDYWPRRPRMRIWTPV